MTGLSKDVLLVCMPVDPRPAWIDKMKAKHPGLDVRWLNIWDAAKATIRPHDDGGPELWDGVTLLVPSYFPPPKEFLSSVRFVQLTSAGADKWIDHETYQDEDVVFCTANGAHPQIAEWVIGSWLSHQHRFSHYAELMQKREWAPPLAAQVQDSYGLRMGILGYGAIGRQCGRVAASLGMEIYAHTRSPRTTSESRRDRGTFCLPGTGDPDGLLPTRWSHGDSRAAIDDFLSQQLDILVISLPLTESSRGLLSTDQFAILGRGRRTFVSNVARGPLINQDALLAALQTGQIRGAALDVADPEPLPAQHSLWTAPNLLLTPHVSWSTTNDLWGRMLRIIETNLDKLGRGEPLINVVNRKLHY